MDPSIHQSAPAPKEPPKLTRGLYQGPPLPNTRYPSSSPSTQVLKIGDKELTFHMTPLPEAESQQRQGAARGLWGIGRGAGPIGKVELPFSRLERMQNSSRPLLTQEAIENSDWLEETGGESMPIAGELEGSRNESDWSSEREGMDSNSELESEREYIPAFQPTSPVTKESNDKSADLEGADRILYIMRGCPGSGKTTLARELRGETGRVFSTDDFFVQSDGEYVFDPKKVAVYHKRNHDMAREAISEGVSPVVIDNTNTTAWEMRPYVETGLRHGYKIQFVEPDTSWRYDPDQLSLKNSHGVPLESIKRMLKRFQKNPTVESVLGKSALQRILQETRHGDFCPELEDELSSNQDTFNSSTDEGRSAGSSPVRDKSSISDVTPLLPADGEESLLPEETPDRYSIKLEPEPEPTDSGTMDTHSPPTDTTSPLLPDKELAYEYNAPQIGPLNTRTGCLVSNQERFNQQLVRELTNSPRGASLFCLNLQSLTVLQEILNIDKTLLAQNNFPLAQLLLPPHVLSQLSHTQVANFQHNYQRYLQHIMQSRPQESRPFIPKPSVPTPLLSPRSQSAASLPRLPPVFSHPRVNQRLPAQTNIPEQCQFVPAPGGNRFQHKQSNPELKPEPKPLTSPTHNGHQPSNTADPLTNQNILFPSNQGMQLNSKIELFNHIPNESIKSPCSVTSQETVPVENKPTPDSLPKEQQICLQQTNNKQTQFRDEIFPNTDTTSSKLDSDENDASNTSSDISPTLSPSDRSLSTSDTIDNSSVSVDKLTPLKPFTDTRALSTNNGEACNELILATDNIQDSETCRLTDNQNTILPEPSLMLEGLSDQLDSSGRGVSSPSGTETKCVDIKESTPMNASGIGTNSVPIPIPSNEPDSMKCILSEKIDWGDSSDSDKCVPSPILSPDLMAGEQAGHKERTPPGGFIAPWDAWGGWNSNFITHNNAGVSTGLPDTIVAKNSSQETARKPAFDPTIQPPRKLSCSSLKSANENTEFSPAFSRFRSMDSDAPIRSPRKMSASGDTSLSRAKWAGYAPNENNRVSLLPGGAEWQWNKMPAPGLSRNNGNSEGSSPRSDPDDPRNSKPLNPFAVPWKPFLPNATQNSSDSAEKLGHLKGFFPTLSARELQAVLSEHDSNIDRAVEAIIEQAEVCNLDLPMSSQVPLPNKMAKKLRSPKKSEKVTTPLDASAPEFKTVLLDDATDAKWQQNSATFDTSTPPTSAPVWTDSNRPNGNYSFNQMIDSSSLPAVNQSALGFTDSSPLKETYTADVPLVLELDSSLANQLIKQFGPLPGCTKETSLDPSLSHIPLTSDTALLLHQLWCKSIEAVSPSDQYYASPGQGAPWVPPEDPIQQTKSQLYNMYPGIDTQALDEILSDKNFSLSAANEYICTALSNAQKVSKESMAPSFAVITQRGSQSFPPLPTKNPRTYNHLFPNQNTKNIF